MVGRDGDARPRNADRASERGAAWIVHGERGRGERANARGERVRRRRSRRTRDRARRTQTRRSTRRTRTRRRARNRGERMRRTRARRTRARARRTRYVRAERAILSPSCASSRTNRPVACSCEPCSLPPSARRSWRASGVSLRGSRASCVPKSCRRSPGSVTTDPRRIDRHACETSTGRRVRRPKSSRRAPRSDRFSSGTSVATVA